jgi:4-amino-4-deoxy-L-arabinose transferase-like glycosyltransferase
MVLATPVSAGTGLPAIMLTTVRHLSALPYANAVSRKSGLPALGGRLRWLPLALLIAAVAGFAALGAGEARTDAPTFDEPVYVAAGVAAVLHHDLAFNAEHPPLPKALAALPVLLARPVVPGNGTWSGNDERAYAARFIRAQLAAGTLRRVTFASRLVPLAETAGVALAAYALAAELFGAAAGLLAGLLWLSSPLVLGIGHLDGTDVPFALAVTLGSWALARWLRLRTTRALVWTGLALALVAGTQISGALVVLVSLAVIAGAGWRSGVRRALGQAGLAALLAWAGLWLPYIVLDPAVLARPTIIAPQPYLSGLAFLASYHAGAGPGYLAGVSFTGARWWYWPVSLLVKMPATALALLLAGLAAWCWADPGARRRAALAVALPGIALAAFTITSPFNIGVRLLLPVIALWAAAAGALAPAIARLRQSWRPAAAAGAAVLAAAAVIATGLSYPGSLSWTAPPFRPGYTAATNSDVDWGQGFWALRSWSAGRHPWVSYFGPRGLTAALIPSARQLPAAAPGRVSGWVAVSATALTSADRAQLGWLWSYCPVRVLDGSVLLYRFARPPAALARPATPALPCPGQWSHRG